MGLKSEARRLAAKKNGQTQLVPVLNDPTKAIAVPVKYRKELFSLYEIEEGSLVGDAPFHIVFVREGVTFCILSRREEQARITLHGVDLRPGEETNVEMVGSEIYELWKSFRADQLMSYDQLKKNYASLHKKLPQSS